MVLEIQLEDITEYATSVNVYKDGEVQAYPVGSDKFSEICAEWNGMLADAHTMPAYGVSLHNETVKQMKNGIWAEFVFDKQYCSDGLPYEKLLIAVRSEWYGFNIVRYTQKSGYDGRCFYYDLNGKDMSSFYNCLVK